MTLSDFDDKTYKDVVEALTPRHAPATAMRFLRRGRLMHLLRYAARFAAILVVGVAVGIAVSRPDTTMASDKVTQLGLQRLHEASGCDIAFNARLLPSTPRRPLRLSPAGHLTPVNMTYARAGNSSSITCFWTYGGVANTLELRGDSCLLVSDGVRQEAQSGEALAVLDKVFNSNYASLKKWLGIENAKLTKNGDRITVDFKAAKEKMEVTMDFSDNMGRIVALKVYDASVSPRLLMLETTSIKYNL